MVAIDEDRYGDWAEDADEVFLRRLRNSPGWFWVAEVRGVVHGLLSFAPTDKGPDDFESWEKSTAGGTLDGVVDPSGRYIYAVALTVSSDCPEPNVGDELMAVAGRKVIETKKRGVVFSARMPGYRAVAEQMTADEYAHALRSDGTPLDPQLRMYRELGMQMRRVVPGGFAADAESCGYGVVFWAPTPFLGWPLPRLWGRVFEAIATRPRLFSLAMKLP